MAGDVKRYVFLVDANRIPFSDESEHGEWVKYEDHAARLTALEQENKRLRQALKEIAVRLKQQAWGDDWEIREYIDEMEQIVCVALTHEDKP